MSDNSKEFISNLSNKFTDPGKKIKFLGNILGWFGLILALIGMFQIGSKNFNGWISLIGGISGYIFSWFLDGLGQLVTDVHEIRNFMIPKSKKDNTIFVENFECVSLEDPIKLADCYCDYCKTSHSLQDLCGCRFTYKNQIHTHKLCSKCYNKFASGQITQWK